MSSTLKPIYTQERQGLAVLVFLSGTCLAYSCTLSALRLFGWLQELNALPFIAMTANCFAWIVYGYVTVDFYIYIGNLAGLMCGVFYTLTCYKFSKEQVGGLLPGKSGWAAQQVQS